MLYNVLLGVQYISTLLMLVLCVIITSKWKKPLHGWLFFYCITTLINNASYLAVMLARTEESAVLAIQISYLGRSFIPFALLHFVLVLSNVKIKKSITFSLAAVHSVTYFSVLLLDKVPLYYSSHSFVNEGLFPHFIHTNGIWHYVNDAFIFSYIIIGLVFLFKFLHKQKHPRRIKQVILIISAVFTDCTFYIVQFFHIIPGYDLTILGYTLATVILFIAIFRYDMLGTKELARDFVIDRVSEGVIITDENGNVVDFNQKAASIIPKIETEPKAAIKEISSMIAENISLDTGDKKYTPKEEDMVDDNHVAGKVYMFSDDTEHYKRAEKLTREMMLALSKTVDAKDRYTNGHSQRVARYSKEIARRMGKSRDEQELIYEMGLLHDIGKIGVSGEILNKTSRLTDEEFAKIKEHTVIGCNILRQITVVPELADGARNHHERFDGRGYPDGLEGEEIPEAARIICLADCYDAMTSTRTYSKPKTQQEVRSEIERCKGSQFDPEIADIMIAMIDSDIDFEMHE